MPEQTLAQRVRAKFPGEYDDLSDRELESKVLAKYPEYKDIPLTSTAAPSTPPPRSSSGGAYGALSTIGDVATGAVKGAANTAIGLGQMVHMVPGVTKAVDALYGHPGISETAFKEARQAVVPTNTAQHVGYTGEQVGEFFLPVGTAGKAADIAKSALIGTAQAGPAAGATSAALTAVIPGAKAAKTAANFVERSAQKSVAQALGATKEWAKSDAAKLAPEILERGITGSRPAMQAQAQEMSQEVGRRLGAAYKAAGAAGETISGTVVQGELQLAKDAFLLRNAAGKMEVIPGAERVVKKLDNLADWVGRQGPDIPVDKAAKVKTAWDRIAAKAGLYGPKAMANATDSADAWALREGASSIRTMLQQANPDIAALSKEYGFWKGLRNVLKETEQRTQAQGPGLISSIAGTGAGSMTGAVVGLTGGGAAEMLSTAALTGVAAKQLTRMMQSPYWKTAVAAPMKHELAKALAAGSTSAASSIVAQMTAALPSQAKQALSQ